ncbi:MAG TPA: hypothetical protein VLN59_15550, partial [Burkholderiales bacterium]|nr:hypothetical protein [Burkholderiales bacterium]
QRQGNRTHLLDRLEGGFERSRRAAEDIVRERIRTIQAERDATHAGSRQAVNRLRSEQRRHTWGDRYAQLSLHRSFDEIEEIGAFEGISPGKYQNTGL